MLTRCEIKKLFVVIIQVICSKQSIYAGLLLVCFWGTCHGNNEYLEEVQKLRKQGEYARAAKHCKNILEQNEIPETQRKILTLELAACYQFDTRKSQTDAAIEVYKKFLENWEADPLAAKANFNLARCLEFTGKRKKRYLEDARCHYKIVYEKFPDSLWADQSYFWEAMSYAVPLNPETAADTVKRLQKFEERFPESILRAVVFSEISELSCTYLEDYDLAIASGIRALELGLGSPGLCGKIRYRLAYLYQYKKADLRNALKWYKELVAASPMKSDPNYFVAEERISAIINKLKHVQKEESFVK